MNSFYRAHDRHAPHGVELEAFRRSSRAPPGLAKIAAAADTASPGLFLPHPKRHHCDDTRQIDGQCRLSTTLPY
jgi:hypothetical protein